LVAKDSEIGSIENQLPLLKANTTYLVTVFSTFLLRISPWPGLIVQEYRKRIGKGFWIFSKISRLKIRRIY